MMLKFPLHLMKLEQIELVLLLVLLPLPQDGLKLRRYLWGNAIPVK